MMLDLTAFVRRERKTPYSDEYKLELPKLVLQACGIEKLRRKSHEGDTDKQG